MKWPFTVRIPIKPAIKIRKPVYGGCLTEELKIRGFLLKLIYNSQN
jgi:hypothetical protein